MTTITIIYKGNRLTGKIGEIRLARARHWRDPSPAFFGGAVTPGIKTANPMLMVGRVGRNGEFLGTEFVIPAGAEFEIWHES